MQGSQPPLDGREPCTVFGVKQFKIGATVTLEGIPLLVDDACARGLDKVLEADPKRIYSNCSVQALATYTALY